MNGIIMAMHVHVHTVHRFASNFNTLWPFNVDHKVHIEIARSARLANYECGDRVELLPKCTWKTNYTIKPS
jgi:hypothetical protein